MSDRNPFTKPDFREAYEKYPWFEGYPGWDCPYPLTRVIKDGMSFSGACELARKLATFSGTVVHVARLLVYPVWEPTGLDDEERIVDWNVHHKPDEQWGVVATISMDYDAISNVFDAYRVLNGEEYAEELAREDSEQEQWERLMEEDRRNYKKDLE
jgi:hypothetical protein